MDIKGILDSNLIDSDLVLFRIRWVQGNMIYNLLKNIVMIIRNYNLLHLNLLQQGIWLRIYRVKNIFKMNIINNNYIYIYN